MKFLQDMSYDDVAIYIQDAGFPSYRASQLYQWICHGVRYDKMSNIPALLIQKLKSDGYCDEPVKIVKSITSEKDGTIKLLYALNDGNVIEGVLMKYKYGNTLCVSTQVGCRMNCAFCASGLDGLVRNLSCGEILGQIIAVNEFCGGGRSVTNVVLMGSGEPLDNYANTVKFLTCVSDNRGLNISKRNISISTCGLCDKIKQLCDDGYTPVLTISLHAPDDEIRRKIMPISQRYSLAELINAAKYYFDKTGRRIIFEYSLIAGVNDSIGCAFKLAKLLKGLPCHVNLIRLNSVKEKGLRGTSMTDVKAFMNTLTKSGISVTLRRTMGSDIEGACGQLRRKHLSETADE
ncbi:MAG: 23S rRNA (adenine(2503)-C(2))-methyltransferase RlmN [Clostridia bacterium]|nr:23S rRNA (adenine(2503)-C(2))-methyltransferase RlmN [Clostridia bacterium]